MNLMPERNAMIYVNDVIQVTAGEKWCGCLLQVDEVRDWGVIAYLHIPQKGDAYIRLLYGSFEKIGTAVMCRIKDGEL